MQSKIPLETKNYNENPYSTQSTIEMASSTTQPSQIHQMMISTAVRHPPCMPYIQQI